MKEYLFYPGCSMESTAKSYFQSVMQVCNPLEIHLMEIDDWNCCGATEYLSLDRIPAYSLIARNLALAQNQANGSRSIVAPCSACYLNLTKADHYMREDQVFGEKINKALSAGNLHYSSGEMDIHHLLDVVLNDIGIEEIKSKVVKPLTNLRVAPFVGCMVPRPDYGHHFSDSEHPTELDDLLKALGAEVIDFPLKTACCGGHMTQIGPDTAFELIRRLISSANEYKADALVTICPMCQMNLDAFQGQMNGYFKTNYKIPILFFTQLMGIAFGLEPEKLGFGSEFVSARPAMKKIGVKTPEPATISPERRKSAGLPMPPPLKKDDPSTRGSKEDNP